MFLTANAADNINNQLFLVLNAPAQASPLMLEIGKGCASYLIVLFPLLLVGYWFSFNPRNQHQVLLATTTSLLALTVNVIIGLLWQHPRPFMVPIGHTFLSHVADSSFPSDHMTLACAISFSLILGQKMRVGVGLLIIGLAIAWGRIYMGVHFPADMVGSMLVALFCAWAVKKSEVRLAPLFHRILRLNDYVLGVMKGRRLKQ